MATAEPSKQTNVRLPLYYHEQLQQAAKQQGKAAGTLARELLVSALDGGEHAPLHVSAPAVDTDLMMERLDSIEDSIGAVSTTTHTALRAIMRALLEDPIEAQNMSKILDATLGPMPTGGRT